jgi:hypothetical protein
MGLVFGLVALIVVGFGLYVRLAPSDPARWHIAAVSDAAADCTVRAGRGDARAACATGDAPAALLARLDVIALATPRTTRLAGSVEEGRITWITRSALWGFPDYTTAEVRAEGAGARVDLYARLRFGGGDMGVNAARLTDWLGRLTQK